MRILSCLIAPFLLNFAIAVAAQNLPDAGITVTGLGEVTARPDALEINLLSVGSGELSADALTRQNSTRQRILDAFDRLKQPGLKVEITGLHISSGDTAMAGNIIINGNPPPVKANINITADIKVLVTGIDQLKEEEITDLVSKLLDTAKDAGGQLATNQSAGVVARLTGQQLSGTAVTFVVQDIADAREKAAKAAFAQARDRAERIAKTAGVSLGQVAALQETLEANTPGESTRMNRAILSIYGNGMLDGGDTKDTRMTSEKFGPIPIRVNVRARFEIAKDQAAKN
jgi:uncharacterized protein YggE